MCIRVYAAVTLHFRGMITTVSSYGKMVGPFQKCFNLCFAGSIADWNGELRECFFFSANICKDLAHFLC